MKAATLFSGIGAPEMAMPHWTWIWHAEIEKFPAAVMAERFPESVNLGDVTAHDFVDRALAIGRPDILVFGSPCQSFSVAGKRLGLDDARGNLALVALGIVARLRPDWFVFENVPGLLSSANGSDFGLFLRAVEECGYLGVWRGLDAQYFGLAQRRKRVFFVGRAGDWRGPAAVLLEPESLCGDSPSREQARQEIAVPIGAGSTRSGGRVGYREAAAGQVIPQAFGGGNQSGSIEVATTTTTKNGERGRQDPTNCDLIAFSVKDHGADAGELSPTLRAGNHSDSHANGGSPPAVTVALRGREGGGTAELGGEVATALRASGGGGDKPHVLTQAVRRLMPVECERLQGFPDHHTAIFYRGKPAADGPRYKAIGNSMAVPVVRWILTRIEFVDRLLKERVA